MRFWEIANLTLNFRGVGTGGHKLMQQESHKVKNLLGGAIAAATEGVCLVFALSTSTFSTLSWVVMRGLFLSSKQDAVWAYITVSLP